MQHKFPVILRAADVARAELPFVQRLDERSRFFGTWLTGLAGLKRVGVSRGRIPPGGMAFTYHAHLVEEEWVYILEGRAHARIDGRDYDLDPGDFAAFPVPQAPHVLTNPFATDCVYLFGGERGLATDVLDFPDLGKQYALVREPTRTGFRELGAPAYWFGRADQPQPQPGTAAWQVIGCKGCGSVIVEAALLLAEIPYTREEVDYLAASPARDRLAALNPLVQVPTVVMPDGAVMTETLAVILHLDELAPACGLLPGATEPLRREALRWLTFLVAAIYPTFTYGDDPAKWGGGDALRESTNAHREKLWRYLETVAKAPWFLGARFSAIDLYITVMTRWRPNRAWFAEHTPRLHAIGVALDDDPRLQALWAANF
jgi:GST-like protein